MEDCEHKPVLNEEGLWVCRKCGVVLEPSLALERKPKSGQVRFTLSTPLKQIIDRAKEKKFWVYAEYTKVAGEECAIKALERAETKEQFWRLYQLCKRRREKLISALASVLEVPPSQLAELLSGVRSAKEFYNVLHAYLQSRYSYVSKSALARLVKLLTRAHV